jgi:rRNA-processing protein FCF1
VIWLETGERSCRVTASVLDSWAMIGISYAHAFAVETAREQNAILVTGDPELRQLSRQEPIELLWVGKKQAH